MPDGNDVFFVLKPSLPSNARVIDEAFEAIVCQRKDVREKKNSRRIGLAKINLNFTLKTFCHGPKMDQALLDIKG